MLAILHDAALIAALTSAPATARRHSCVIDRPRCQVVLEWLYCGEAAVSVRLHPSPSQAAASGSPFASAAASRPSTHGHSHTCSPAQVPMLPSLLNAAVLLELSVLQVVVAAALEDTLTATSCLAAWEAAEVQPLSPVCSPSRRHARARPQPSP